MIQPKATNRPQHEVRYMLWIALVLLCLIHTQADRHVDEDDEISAMPARHFQVPMAEILQQPLYLSTNGADELVVK